jgi:putative Ca2+/H+ antiporter (TMEM165/GDT1 family)
MLSIISIFFTIFFAELGDKTQVTTMLFAANGSYKPLTIFLAVCLALCTSSALAILVGLFAQKYLQYIPVKLISGSIFILMGLYSIYEYFYKK